MRLPSRSKVARNSILIGALLLTLGLWRADRHPEEPTPGSLYVVAVLLLALGLTLALRRK